MGYPKTLVYVRHAESESNVVEDLDARAKLGKGTQHFRITQRGVQQAKNAGTWLREKFGTFDRCFVSSYGRTRETLGIMYPDATPIENALLDEAHFGFKHYATAAERQELYPQEMLRNDLEGKYHFRPVGGESWPDIELRVRMFLAELRETCANQSVLVVGHGAWFAAFRRVVDGLTIEQLFDQDVAYDLKNCEARIYRGKAGTFTPWNRTTLAHVGGRLPVTPAKHHTLILPPEV